MAFGRVNAYTNQRWRLRPPSSLCYNSRCLQRRELTCRNSHLFFDSDGLASSSSWVAAHSVRMHIFCFWRKPEIFNIEGNECGCAKQWYTACAILFCVPVQLYALWAFRCLSRDTSDRGTLSYAYKSRELSSDGQCAVMYTI